MAMKTAQHIIQQASFSNYRFPVDLSAVDAAANWKMPYARLSKVMMKALQERGDRGLNTLAVLSLAT